MTTQPPSSHPHSADGLSALPNGVSMDGLKTDKASVWIRCLPAIAFYAVFCMGSYLVRFEAGAGKWVRAPGHLLYDLYYIAALLILYVIGVPTLYAFTRVRSRLLSPDTHTSTERWRHYRARYFSRHRLITAVVAFVLVGFFTNSYTRLKTLVPLISTFRFDDLLANWDAVLHFGHHPYELTFSLLSPTVLPFADDFYHVLWPLLTFFAVPAALAWTANVNLWRHYALAHMLTWVLLGLALGSLISAAGPVYYGRVEVGTDPFVPLHNVLDQVARHEYLRAVAIQDFLWHAYVNEAQGIGTGIMAMASLHVATPALWAAAFWHVNRTLAYFSVVYAIGTLVASIALGWHYAIDGYVALAGVPIIWWATGLLLRKWDQHLDHKQLRSARLQ